MMNKPDTSALTPHIRHTGILGGTFDPIHNGHIQCARYVLQHCQLDEVRLMPCHLPPHRASPGVSAAQRAAMVELAIADKPGLTLERLELEKNSPSYTVDSLQLLQQRDTQCRWYFIIGMDSLCYFTKWKDWQHILHYAHLIVCQRPGYSATDGDATFLLRQYGVSSLSALREQASGNILLLDNPEFAISATQIRAALQQGASTNDSLDPSVRNYIQSAQLYQG